MEKKREKFIDRIDPHGIFRALLLYTSPLILWFILHLLFGIE